VGGGGCQASFAYFDSAGVYHFVNTSNGVNLVTASFYWDFGDGTTSSLFSPNHVFNGAGPYWVCLTITDTMFQCFDTFCDSVWTGNGTNCQAAISAIADSAGSGWTFYDASTGTNANTTWFWTISDGTTATGSFFHHNFSTLGWFQVCLFITVYDSLNQNILCTSQTCDSIFVSSGGGAFCNASWAYQGSMFVTFFADLSTSTDTIVSWLWDFGDGATSTLQNPVHTYALSGFYYVCLTIQTVSNGTITCADTYCQTIYAGNNTAGCQANFSMYPDSMGTGFQFQNISTGTSAATTYAWSFGDGNFSTAENPFHAYATTGWFNVCLTITDTTSNCTSTICDSLNVGVVALCNAYFVWTGDTTNGVQFFQFNNNVPGIVYAWNFGDGDSSSLADPYHQYAAAGSYYACLTVSELDSNGFVLCTGTYCDSVFAGANGQSCAPQIFVLPDSNAWGNGNLNFSVSSSCGNITSATWNFGDGTTGTGVNASHVYAATGWYYACVDVEVNGIIYTQCDSVFALRLVGIEYAGGNLIAISVFPNPAGSYVNITYSIYESQHVRVNLYDVAGREVLAILEQDHHAGVHKVDIRLDALSEGIYILKISAGNGYAARRIVVNR
jgi:PKD repeat protein